MKITPAHDFNDFEVGRRHELPLINVLDVEAQARSARTMRRFLTACRRRRSSTRPWRCTASTASRRASASSTQLEARGLLDKIEPNTHTRAARRPLGRGGRAVSDRPMVRRRQDAGAAGDRGGARRARPCSSRSNGKRPTSTGWRTSSPGASRARSGGAIKSRPGTGRTAKSSLPRTKTMRSPTRWRTTPKSRRSRPRRGMTSPPIRSGSAWFANEYLHRDEDVLDTWFSSALWPFSTLGWPDETPELKRYYPTSVLVTGFDIIFFWVARMMMMGLHFMKEVPFHDRLHPRARARRARAEDVEVEGQRHRPARAHRRIRRRRAALHAGRHGGAGPRHQALRAARRGLPQFRDQALECRALCGDERLRARSGFRSARRRRRCSTVGSRTRPRRRRAEVTTAIEAYKFNEAAACGLSLRLEHLSATGISSWQSPFSTGADGAAKDETRATTAWVLRRDRQAAAPVHAVHHRGTVGGHGGDGAEARAACWRSRRGRSSTGSATPRQRPRSAG